MLYFEAWARNIASATPTFVPVEAWTEKAEQIKNHIDLSQSTPNPIVTVQGLAGVGKTRFVYEIVSRLGAAKTLVLYAMDGVDGETMARYLANHPRTRGILITDECSLNSREKIKNSLSGHRERVRAVCIDNSGDRLGGVPELWLDKLPFAVVERILEENFPSVGPEQRRTYSKLAGGYVRLAADMCEHDPEIQQQTHFGPATNSIDDYLRLTIPDDKRLRVVEAIALFQKVGFAEEVSGELDALCALTGGNRQEVLEIALAMKDAPGFIAKTTRYLYVTPEIIAVTAFKRGWRRWFEPDPQAVLSRIPSILLPSFQVRLAQSAAPEVRALTGHFFWNTVAGLGASSLADPESTDRLATLVNTAPGQYLPALVRLVSEASLEELRQNRSRPRGWTSRRTLVETAERFVAFPEYFLQAEQVLRRLAMAENEPEFRNNATGVWKQLFKIQLSGTSVPFPERIELLKKLLFSPEADAERDLAVKALADTLDSTHGRLVGPPVIAGRLVPADWSPGTSGEFRKCLDLIVSLLARVIGHGTSSMKQAAWQIFGQRTRFLLSNGMLPALRAILAGPSIPEIHLPQILECIDNFLQYECGSTSGTLVDDLYCRDVAAWRGSLTPSDFFGRLKAVVGKDPWHHNMREEIDGIPSEITPLAEELKGDPGKLKACLLYLNSSAAPSAGLLGMALARLDREGRLLDGILREAETAKSSAFAVGFVSDLLKTQPEHGGRVNGWLDRMESEAPELAYYLALSVYEVSRPLERTLRMISERKLHVHSLRNFVANSLLDRMSPQDLRTALSLFLDAGDSQSLRIALDFIFHLSARGRLDDSPDTVSAMWRVLEASAVVEDRSNDWWVQIVQRLAKTEPAKACDVALLALTGKDFEKRGQAWCVLHTAAEIQPDLVMRKVGMLLLDPEREWHVRIGTSSGLFQCLPLESVKRWLTTAGILGARVLAHHLQPPSVDSEGSVTVPPLTEYVLRRWGDDETVFARFVASTHHARMFVGDIAATHRNEAQRARAFLSHPIPAIRSWAEQEVARGEALARNWTIQMEEQFL